MISPCVPFVSYVNLKCGELHDLREEIWDALPVFAGLAEEQYGNKGSAGRANTRMSKSFSGGRALSVVADAFY